MIGGNWQSRLDFLGISTLQLRLQCDIVEIGRGAQEQLDEERLKKHTIDLLRMLRCRRPAKSTSATYDDTSRRRQIMQTAEAMMMLSTAMVMNGHGDVRSSIAPEERKA